MKASARTACRLILPLCLAAADATPAPSILLIRLLHGDGAVHRTGSRVRSALAVEVTDEAGNPIEGAAVSFRLPAEGPGGAFASGLHTDVVLTGAEGRAEASNIQWNKSAGLFEIRVTAAKGRTRASLTVMQRLTTGQEDETASVSPRLAQSNKRWKTVLLVGGAAAGALLAGLAMAKRPAGGQSAGEPVSVGTPIISVGGF